MAYNTLRGTVNFSSSPTGTIESMVDDYSDQTIAGIKTFSSVISGSSFWNTTTGTEVGSAAISSITGDGANRLIVSDGDGTATCNATLTFSAGALSASYFSGSGDGLYAVSLATGKVTGSLSAANISYGNGLDASGVQLVVDPGDGISVDGTGVAVDTAANGGLSFSSNELLVDPFAATNKAALSAADAFLIADTDASNTLKKVSGSAIQTYMQNTLTFSTPGGPDNSIQTKSGTSFAGSGNLTFDGTTLGLSGQLSASIGISASVYQGNGSQLAGVVASATAGRGELVFPDVTDGQLTGNGALVFNSGSGGAQNAYLTSSNLVINYDTHLTGALYKGYTFRNTNYTISEDDQVVYFDTALQPLTASLPNAGDSDGIVLIVKNVGTSNDLLVSASIGSNTLDSSTYDIVPPAGAITLQAILGTKWVVTSRS
jgi:hypothetical protein